MKNQTQTQIRVGVVTSFSERKNLGWLRIPGEPNQVAFSLDEQRELVAGFSHPEFSSKGSKSFPMPTENAQLAVLLKIGYVSDHVANVRRGLRRVAQVAAWDYFFRLQDAKQEIADRPVYEVWEFRLYNGEPTSQNQKEMLNSGTALGLQAVYPRGAVNDPFAPEETVMGFTRRRRFFERTAKGLVQVPDPRPLLSGEIEVVPPLAGDNGMLLATDAQVMELMRAVLTHAVGK